MDRLVRRFEELQSRGEAALVLFLTAGDQPLSDLPGILSLLSESGADVIEVGIPFSDPFGEGPAIQASSQRALEHGATPLSILDAMSRVRLPIPLVTMGYYNPILRTGLAEFARKSGQSNSSGTIVSDLVPDESGAWRAASSQNGLATIFLVAPTSSEQRIREVAANSTGFVYVVSRTGVTGSESQVPEEVGDLVAKVRALTHQPICVGFGISTPDHVRMVSAFSDGAVVGSSLVRLLHECWPAEPERIREYVRSLKSATRRSSPIRP